MRPCGGIEALAVVDRNSLAGIVRAHEDARYAGSADADCRKQLASALS